MDNIEGGYQFCVYICIQYAAMDIVFSTKHGRIKTSVQLGTDIGTFGNFFTDVKPNVIYTRKL